MEKKLRRIASFLADAAIIMGIAFLLAQHVVSIGTVEGRSMEPTLVDNQVVIVDRVSYKFTKPKRFDVVVVKFPNESNYWIKRVIGLPGDVIEYKSNGKLYVNFEEVPEEFLSDDVSTNWFTTRQFYPATSGVIPEGKYFVVGDNRGNSTDSRMLGAIDEENILGNARVSIYPFDRLGVL